MQDVTPALAESFGLKDARGVVVAGILRNGPAAVAGLKPGDVILDIGDKEIHDSHDVMNATAQKTPGTSVSIKIIRQGHDMTLDAKVGERPRVSNPEHRG